jgi:hypothetical protein
MIGQPPVNMYKFAGNCFPPGVENNQKGPLTFLVYILPNINRILPNCQVESRLKTIIFVGLQCILDKQIKRYEEYGLMVCAWILL